MAWRRADSVELALPVDPNAQRLLAMVKAGARSGAGEPSLEQRRRAFGNLMRFAGAPVPIGAVEDRSCPGPAGPIALRIYTPVSAQADVLPGLLYLHGGGMVAGNFDTHDALCRTLANGAGARVVAVDYRLAPEHPFPAAVEDALAAARFVLANPPSLGLDPERIAVGGDSAGATLACVITQEMRDDPGRQFRAQLLLCPVLDCADETDSRHAFAEGYLLDRTAMVRDLADYAPGHLDLADPRISPLRAKDLGRLPPALIHTAEYDPVRDEGRGYADRLAAAGIAVRSTCHSGMIHHFYGLTGVIPAAKTILAAVGSELKQALG